ncbi:MAG TPA: 50S ribosomal protein L21 [Thermoanaerobaculia bacterium]|nr:50S ribosomal protein L21 [Thermoanaerobaculia bacterium]
MYAIVSTGGKQIKVSPGDVVRIEKLAGEPVAKGDSIVFQEITFVGDGDNFRAGSPLIDGVSVRGTVVSPSKTRKVLIFKKKRTKQYRRTKGHRQQMVDVRIDGIEG